MRNGPRASGSTRTDFQLGARGARWLGLQECGRRSHVAGNDQGVSWFGSSDDSWLVFAVVCCAWWCWSMPLYAGRGRAAVCCCFFVFFFYDVSTSSGICIHACYTTGLQSVLPGIRPLVRSVRLLVLHLFLLSVSSSCWSGSSP